jgi:hypothetical protein
LRSEEHQGPEEETKDELTVLTIVLAAGRFESNKGCSSGQVTKERMEQ